MKSNQHFSDDPRPNICLQDTDQAMVKRGGTHEHTVYSSWLLLYREFDVDITFANPSRALNV